MLFFDTKVLRVGLIDFLACVETCFSIVVDQGVLKNTPVEHRDHVGTEGVVLSWPKLCFSVPLAH